MPKKDYFSEIQDWRREYEQKIASPSGWLAISGLFWLEEGENPFGSDQANPIALPRGSAPEQSGMFILRDGKITMRAASGVAMSMDDKLIESAEITLGEWGSSEWITINDLKISVIQRGARLGVRVYDPKNPPRVQLSRFRWFPIEESYVIQARLEPCEKGATLSITTVLGDVLELPCPGYVDFALNQQQCRLYPVMDEDDDELWFMLRDGTSGSLTFAGGRYIRTPLQENGMVTLDFNKIHNPPCAYTDFATCPLPPPQNRLEVPLMAGEQKF